jgi:hypothetical protein
MAALLLLYSGLSQMPRSGLMNDASQSGQISAPLHRKLTTSPSAASNECCRLE